MPAKPPKTSISNVTLNLEEVPMDNFCRAHQANHLNKTCPQFINMMELFINEGKYPEGSTQEDEKEKVEELLSNKKR